MEHCPGCEYGSDAHHIRHCENAVSWLVLLRKLQKEDGIPFNDALAIANACFPDD